MFQCRWGTWTPGYPAHSCGFSEWDSWLLFFCALEKCICEDHKWPTITSHISVNPVFICALWDMHLLYELFVIIIGWSSSAKWWTSLSHQTHFFWVSLYLILWSKDQIWIQSTCLDFNFNLVQLQKESEAEEEDVSPAEKVQESKRAVLFPPQLQACPLCASALRLPP